VPAVVREGVAARNGFCENIKGLGRS